MTDNGYEAALVSFLDHMDSGDFAGALALFAEDATYVRPVLNQPGAPWAPGSSRTTARPRSPPS